MRILLILLLVPSLAYATTETLNPDGDHTDSGAAAGYAASPGCSSGSTCTGADCFTYVDDTVSSGDASHISGTTCNGSGSSDYTQVFTFDDPTVGDSYTGTQTVAMRYFEPVSNGTDPSWTITVLCDAGTITTCTSWAAFNGTTEVSDTTSCTFTAANAATAGCTPAATRVSVGCAASGGSPAGRRSCALDAIEIQGDFTTAASRRIFNIQ